MIDLNIGRIFARWEKLLFPTTPLELRPAVQSTAGTAADSVRAVLDGRRLPIRIDPFTGFESPPGRF
jgi:hypothetical protein